MWTVRPTLPALQTTATPSGPPSSGARNPVDVAVGLLRLVPPRLWIALGVLIAGIGLYLLVRRVAERSLDRVGVGAAIEGTAFERTAREFGTSTAALVSTVLASFVFGLAVIVALTVARVDFADPFWSAVAFYLPRLFVATVVVIVGVVVGDKLEVVAAERLQEVKLPQVALVPRLVKYSVVYVAVLLALAQLDVATLALIVLLAAYLLALIVFGGLASGALLSSSAAGAYLLLKQPYAIGDEIRVGDVQGVVCEMDVFVTHVESGDEEFIVPNRKVFRDGVVRIRQ
jgi:small-conductance mechanosensitive channel